MKGIKDLLDEKDKAVAAARQRFERAVSNLLYVNHPASALWFFQLLSDARPYNKTPAKDNEQPKPERLCDYAVRRIQTLAGRVKDFPKLPEDVQFSNETIPQVGQWLRSNQKKR